MYAVTPIYKLGYITPDHPLSDIGAASQAMAAAAEEALARGGIAPPAAQDLAAVVGQMRRGWTQLAARTTMFSPIVNGGVQTVMLANVVVPAGQTLEARWTCPFMLQAANTNGGVALVIDTVPEDGATFSTGASGFVGRGDLEGGYRNTATIDKTVAVVVQTWLTSGVLQYDRSSTVVAPHRLMGRLL